MHVLVADRAHLRRKLKRTMGSEHKAALRWLRRVNFALTARKFKHKGKRSR